MNKLLKFVAVAVIFSIPMVGSSQVTDTTKKAVIDTTKKPIADSSMMPKTIVDTVRVIVDTVVKKDCYTEYYNTFRERGARPVTDGMQQVVITLKNADGCHCFLGQIEVAAGKIKPPLYFQQENGEYRLVSTVGKKLEAAFTGSITPDELYSIKEGMSVVFRTTDNEYGRLFFYKFVNKGSANNKPAPSAADLIKE